MDNRRSFLKQLFVVLPLSAASAAGLGPLAWQVLRALAPASAGLSMARSKALAAAVGNGYDPTKHYYGMGIQVEKCLGCGRCVEACKRENDIPRKPFFFRTWVERYTTQEDGKVIVDSPNGGMDGFSMLAGISEQQIIKSFFVPKLCNHCNNPPCVQVCPVGATFITRDGVVLVDDKYCIGCRYCIQACPYGARYLHPVRRTADKCTFCYHRITKGLRPACVEACPVEGRIFGDLRQTASPLMRFMRFGKVQVLKYYLNTKPKVYYTGLDMEVR